MASADYVRVNEMRAPEQAHGVLVVDGDQAHLEQGLDELQGTPVRILHTDGDSVLVWEESVGAHSGYAWKW
jgi:hypothetical protein